MTERILRIIRCTDPGENQLTLAFACYFCALFTTAVALVSIGLDQKKDDDSSNEFRQTLLNNLTKQCYINGITNQTSCSYSCNCREVCTDASDDSDIICHQVCDTCNGTQVNYTGYAPDKCGNEQTFNFQDTCKLQQRSSDDSFQCFIENCSTASMAVYVYPINLPDEKHGGMHRIKQGLICLGVSIFCLFMSLCCCMVAPVDGTSGRDHESTNPYL